MTSHNTFERIERVRTLSLGMGLLSLVASLFASFGIWLLVEFGPRPDRDGPPADLAKSVASASCESLQKMCPLLASSFDALNEAHRAGYRQHVHLLRIVLFGALGWGLVSAVSFFYIHAKSRKPRQAP